MAAALGLSRAFARGDDEGSGKEPPKPRSHGPNGRWLKEPEKLIEQLIMPPPKGRQVNEHIFASSQLENVFLIDLGEHSVLIDTGFDHQVDHHLDNLEELGCDLSKIVGILGTHSHVEHTGGLKKARDRLGVPVVAHPNAIKPVSTGDPLQTAAVIPDVKGWKFEYPACPVDETVDQGDVIKIGEHQIHILHIPGHTPDCVGYVWNGHFFTGDAVFGAGLVGWAHEHWLSNYADHADSMLSLIEAQTRCRDVLLCPRPGAPLQHGSPRSVPQKRSRTCCPAPTIPATIPPAFNAVLPTHPLGRLLCRWLDAAVLWKPLCPHQLSTIDCLASGLADGTAEWDTSPHLMLETSGYGSRESLGDVLLVWANCSSFSRSSLCWTARR